MSASDPSESADLAERFVGGDWQLVLARCAQDRRLAGVVSRQASELLLERARARRPQQPGEAVWPRLQRAVLAFARLPGADELWLADRLFEACAREIVAEPFDLDHEVLVWLLDVVPAKFEALIGPEPARDADGDVDVEVEDTIITRALWSLPGRLGAQWLVRMQQDPAASWRYTGTWLGHPWSVEDWIARLHALSDARMQPRPAVLDHLNGGGAAPPRESSAAQVRVACVYARAPTDWLLRVVAGNLASYRTGDVQSDVGLVWWAADGDELDRLRWILELAGPPGTRAALVDAASAGKLIDEHASRVLSATLRRPEWADGEVPWVVDEIVDVGCVRLPDGRLIADDPFWVFENQRIVARLAPGDYPVRVITASHPLAPRTNGAAELIVDPAVSPARWALVGAYTVEAGTGSFMAATLLDDDLRLVDKLDELVSDSFHSDTVATAVVDAQELGSLVAFGVGPQHQQCRTWKAVDGDGNIVRLVTDLGLLDLDPTRSPLPW